MRSSEKYSRYYANKKAKRSARPDNGPQNIVRDFMNFMGHRLSRNLSPVLALSWLAGSSNRGLKLSTPTLIHQRGAFFGALLRDLRVFPTSDYSGLSALFVRVLERLFVLSRASRPTWHVGFL
jgi:hypothetical protein